MKLYKFFKIPADNEPDDDIERKYVLYAITNDKEIAEKFQSDRNMKKFILKIHKGISKEEYAEICNNYETRSSVLEYHTLSTVFGNIRIKELETKVKVLMTNFEYQLVTNADVFTEDMWEEMPYPLIFKKKYVKLLEKLDYIKLYKLFNAERVPFNLLMKIDDELENDDYSGPSIEYDELAMFIRQIKDTL